MRNPNASFMISLGSRVVCRVFTGNLTVYVTQQSSGSILVSPSMVSEIAKCLTLEVFAYEFGWSGNHIVARPCRDPRVVG